MNFQDLRERLKNLQLTDNDRYEILLDITQRQAKRIEHLNDILDQDHRQEVIESMYEESERYREALYAIEDFDIELGDSRDDMKNKLTQIKFIKDKALEESE